ncbi:MAG: LPS export ABC transporter ATP-binding protein [Phycisphaerae bacterium]|nr:LPS export ABC transporter ATP-binding protein [Phycisphaerae bacterium]
MDSSKIRSIQVEPTLLETRSLIKRYSGRTVVDEISIAVGQQSIVGLLGRNGAGKTTTFRMVIGMIVPDEGEVVFEGVNVTRMPMYKRARLGMGYLSQEPSVFQRLSVRDNLLAILETMSFSAAERKRKANLLVERFGLTEVVKSQARFLSGGERRKLEIARAMVTNPSLILLDEPFSGVDPIAVEELQGEIRRLVASGVSILITDHNVERTLEVADKAYIVDHGKVIGAGSPREIIQNELVRKSYLGRTFRGDEFDDEAEVEDGVSEDTPTGMAQR